MRKSTFVKNNLNDTLVTIWENEIYDLNDDQLVTHALMPVKVYILAGPNGCGKSYTAELLKDRFNIVDYDKLHSIDDCVAACSLPSNKPYLLITPIQAKRIGKQLRQANIRVWSCYLQEEKEVIIARIKSRNGKLTKILERRIQRYESLKDKIFQFYGTQQEIIEWLIDATVIK